MPVCPRTWGVESVLHVAGATGRLRTIDFTFDLNETYTFWSGLVGGLFLMLGYFGCDQSQVQRYLTAKSVDAGRHALMMSAFAKIPLQLLILLTGVLVFAFYLFAVPPMLFNSVHDSQIRSSGRAGEYGALDAEFRTAHETRRLAAEEAMRARGSGDPTRVSAATRSFLEGEQRVSDVRGRAETLVRQVSGDANYNDVNYVFPTFVTTQLPIGLVGLMIAAIFAAAMSSIAAELNALSAVTVIDFYRRHFKKQASDQHYLRVSKVATGFWGAFASVTALFAANLGSLIEGRQPLRVVLLRVAAGRIRAGNRCQTRNRDGGVLGNRGWHGDGDNRGHDDLHLLPLAQRSGCSGGFSRRESAQRCPHTRSVQGLLTLSTGGFGPIHRTLGTRIGYYPI